MAERGRKITKNDKPGANKPGAGPGSSSKKNLSGTRSAAMRDSRESKATNSRNTSKTKKSGFAKASGSPNSAKISGTREAGAPEPGRKSKSKGTGSERHSGSYNAAKTPGSRAAKSSGSGSAKSRGTRKAQTTDARSSGENPSEHRKKHTTVSRGAKTPGARTGRGPASRKGRKTVQQTRNFRSRKDLQIQIVHEDNDMIVVSKPSGMLSVPIPNMRSINLLEMLNSSMSIGGEKAITVHRIDRFTSGLVVFAKNSQAHKGLVRQFLGHTPIRTYLSLVRGVMEPDSGELIHYLRQVKQGFRNIPVKEGNPDGTMARLTFRVLERHAETTLVQINLDTGLKNQIRVQFAEAGHPLVGDRHYASDEINETMIDRQALHSWKLELQHPRTGKTMQFEAEVPSDLRKLIDYYRKLRKKA